jgi:hypothetical protein
MSLRRLLLLLALLLAGCATAPPSPDVAPEVKILRAPVRMPSGVDFNRLQVVAQARLIRVYTQMTGIGDTQNDQLLFPPAVAQQLNLTNRQVNRQFMDMILQSRRFEVFDDSTTVIRDGARQTYDGQRMDITIDGEVVGATQEIIDMAPYRKASTTVRLSVQMKDVLSGEELFPAGVSVTGEWGMVSGEGTLLAPGVSLSSPEMQTSLGNDYGHALERALADAVARIGQVLRPVGRVTFTNSSSIDMLGGSRHGFQSGDSVVVFRTDTSMIDGREVITRVDPVAVARCDGVGTDTSHCELTQLDPQDSPKVGDYTVLTDTSATDVRQQ